MNEGHNACSFCEKKESFVKKLIAGKGCYICDECVEMCTDLCSSDKLATMWEQQRDFMSLLQKERSFPAFPVDITSKSGQKTLKDITHHVMDELFEAGQHLKNAKSHRQTLVPDVDMEAYKEELVDALHLYFELAIASGITLEGLYDAYMAKGVVNQKRIKNGY